MSRTCMTIAQVNYDLCEGSPLQMISIALVYQYVLHRTCGIQTRILYLRERSEAKLTTRRPTRLYHTHLSKHLSPVVLADDFNSHVGPEGGPKASGSQNLHGRLLLEMAVFSLKRRSAAPRAAALCNAKSGRGSIFIN